MFIFLSIVGATKLLDSRIEQAFGLRRWSTQSHEEFISVFTCNRRAYRPWRKWFAAISATRCIDCARMYQPDYAVYIT